MNSRRCSFALHFGHFHFTRRSPVHTMSSSTRHLSTRLWSWIIRSRVRDFDIPAVTERTMGPTDCGVSGTLASSLPATARRSWIGVVRICNACAASSSSAGGIGSGIRATNSIARLFPSDPDARSRLNAATVCGVG